MKSDQPIYTVNPTEPRYCVCFTKHNGEWCWWRSAKVDAASGGAIGEEGEWKPIEPYELWPKWYEQYHQDATKQGLPFELLHCLSTAAVVTQKKRDEEAAARKAAAAAQQQAEQEQLRQQAVKDAIALLESNGYIVTSSL